MANKYECEGALPVSGMSKVHKKVSAKDKCQHVSRFNSECHH